MAEQWQQNHHISVQPTRQPPVCREEGTVYQVQTNTLLYHIRQYIMHTIPSLPYRCIAAPGHPTLSYAMREQTENMWWMFPIINILQHTHIILLACDCRPTLAYLLLLLGQRHIRTQLEAVDEHPYSAQTSVTACRPAKYIVQRPPTTPYIHMYVHYIPFPHLRYVPHLDQVDEGAGKILFYLHQCLIQVLLIVIGCQVREIPRATAQCHYIIIRCTIAFYMEHLPQTEVVCTN